MVAVPAPSAFSLAAARLGWPLAEATLLALNGRSLDLVRPHLHPRARILALTTDGEAPAALARLLTQAGFGASRLTVLEALGGARERIRSAGAETFDLSAVDPLNTVAIEVAAGKDAWVIARSPGLPDAFFEHDGQITKREVRALTLSGLAPRRGERLWDIGAGAGSVAIEWLLADPSDACDRNRGPRRSRRTDRAAMPRPWGCRASRSCTARHRTALAGLAPPDAIFIGGGASEPGVLDHAIAALRPGGRLVVNAVTLVTEALLIERHAALGGDLVRIAIARAEPVGSKTGWRPAMPVTQWTWVKP